MRIELADLLRPSGRQSAVPLPLAHAAPVGRRGHRMQRLQVGLFGLACMVLLVALASIIKTTTARTDAEVVAEAVDPGDVPVIILPASDPLAEAGVVPGPPPTDNKPKTELATPNATTDATPAARGL
jgi:hypothetical protein